MTSFIDRVRLGVTAFKEAFLTAPIIDTENWTSLEARRLRYDVNWAAYDGTAYRNINTWATAYKSDYSLYKYIRPIYNPSFRLGEFWKSHLFGGQLDNDAREAGAIPIVTDNESLRPAIAELWKWSRWNINKDVLTTRGSILGDAAIQIIDDVSRGRVYMHLLHPGLIETVDRDPFGNVKGYVLKENRVHDGRTVTYSEEVTREGDFVVYRTYLNGELFAWPENTDRTGRPVSEWREPYTFVPLVVFQHNDVGLEWGWSELHPVRAKMQEVDDIASQISDQVRKTIDPVWLMKGIKNPGTVTLSGRSSTTNVPSPGREEIQALWNVPTDGGAMAMVPDLDLEQTLAHLSGLLEEIERDVLELSPDIHTSSGDASGRALRTARQPVISKVLQRRANYDAALVSAQQMAISIGGFRGYDGYQGFSLDSFTRGDLDHQIADRPVFEEDPLDVAEIATAEWGAAKVAMSAGLSLESYLRLQDWSEDRIADLDIEKPEPVPEQLVEEEDDNETD
jgi:hypothetical protein